MLRLLEQVIHDREFARKTIVQYQSELQSTHKGVTRPFKCNYSEYGKPSSQVFDDKNFDLLKQNDWGGRRGKVAEELDGP